MSLFTNFSEINREDVTSVAIGGFDGLHLGHQELFSKLDGNGAILAIENNHMDLTPDRNREKFSNKPIFYLALDSVVTLSGREFVTLLEEHFKNLQKIVIGYDFRFGNNRSCNASDLKKMFTKEVEVVDEVKVEGISVHSRNIRNFIRLGEIGKANKLLGREYYVYGNVIKGQGLGMRKLYPTLNLSVEKFLLPQEGVYATRTDAGGESYPSVSFIGHRVSTDGSFAIETHILEEVHHLKCESASIYFVQKMRENRFYDKIEELKEQIAEDISSAREILKGSF